MKILKPLKTLLETRVRLGDGDESGDKSASEVGCNCLVAEVGCLAVKASWRVSCFAMRGSHELQCHMLS